MFAPRNPSFEGYSLRLSFRLRSPRRTCALPFLSAQGHPRFTRGRSRSLTLCPKRWPAHLPAARSCPSNFPRYAAVQSTVTSLSPSFKRALPWLSGLVLLAGVVALVVSLVGNTGKPVPDTRSAGPVQYPSKLKPAKLPAAARLAAARWIQTAVLRQRLEEAWTLTAPTLKQGMTLADWKSGDIPVVPYTPRRYFMQARLKVDAAHARDALLEVAMLSKDERKLKSQYFFLELQKVGRRWLVSGWVPRAAPKIPAATG